MASAWQVNYELLPFNINDVKAEVETSTSTKKNKALSEAYAIAAEGHDLAWFKEMLSAHEEAMQDDILAKQAKAEEKAKKANKTPKVLKSTAGDMSDDVDMEDAGDDVAPAAKKTKKNNKRKGSEDVESDKVSSLNAQVDERLIQPTACEDAEADVEDQDQGCVGCEEKADKVGEEGQGRRGSS
jgi:hypothetical protein